MRNTLCLTLILVLYSCGNPAEEPSQQKQSVDEFIVELNISALHEALANNTYTCAEIVQAHINRIEKLNRSLGINAITVMNPKALPKARQQDEQLRAGESMPQIYCVPVVVKDNFDTHDLVTTGGSKALMGSIPPDDAFMVAKLREAGAIVIAKTNMAEWAFSPRETISTSYGTTANAYDPRYTPAGSSGGTASSVALSFAIAGLGSDTGNSIRGPSSHLALFGIRSSIGLTSRDGVIPLLFDRDIAGPMSRTVEDGARLFSVVAGYDPKDPYTEVVRETNPIDYTQFLDASGLQGARIGVLRRLAKEEDSDPEVLALFNSAIKDMTAAGTEIVDPLVIPDLEAHLVKRDDGDYSCNRFRHDMAVYLGSLENPPMKDVMETYEAGVFHPHSKGGFEYFQAGALQDPSEWETPCPDYIDHPGRQAFKNSIEQAMDEHNLDAIVYPSWTYPPALLARAVEDYRGDNSQLLAPTTGLPATTVPMGFTQAGLPTGLQFLGRAFAEGVLFKLSYAYEQSTKHRRPPPSTN